MWSGRGVNWRLKAEILWAVELDRGMVILIGSLAAKDMQRRLINRNGAPFSSGDYDQIIQPRPLMDNWNHGSPSEEQFTVIGKILANPSTSEKTSIAACDDVVKIRNSIMSLRDTKTAPQLPPGRWKCA